MLLLTSLRKEHALRHEGREMLFELSTLTALIHRLQDLQDPQDLRLQVLHDCSQHPFRHFLGVLESLWAIIHV